MHKARESSTLELDSTFEQIRKLGGGGFGSVFLAKKCESGRLVALKRIPRAIDDDEEDEEARLAFQHEVGAVAFLNESDDGRGMGVVYIRDSFFTDTAFWIVQNVVVGGTLAAEIDGVVLPYSERRIAWYALQMADTLSFIHEKQITHHDVKSSNILVDHDRGSRLILCDFGVCAKVGGEGSGYTAEFVAPELAAAVQGGISYPAATSLDVFSFGCVIFELLCGKRMKDVFPSADQPPLPQLISESGTSILSTFEQTHLSPLYSTKIKRLLAALLEPAPQSRISAAQAAHHLRSVEIRQDATSDNSLLAPFLEAVLPLVPGQCLTVDNIQLGVLVMRGPDWDYGSGDSMQSAAIQNSMQTSDSRNNNSMGPVGVVVELDSDACFTTVAWMCHSAQGGSSSSSSSSFSFSSSSSSSGSSSTTECECECYRIGSERKHELIVAHTQLGVIHVPTTTAQAQAVPQVGQLVGAAYPGMVVVHIVHKLLLTSVFFAPAHPIPYSAPPHLPPVPTPAPITSNAHRSQAPAPPPPLLTAAECPSFWDGMGELTERRVTLQPTQDAGHAKEWQRVHALFHARSGGLRESECQILQVERVQSPRLWSQYSQRCQQVAIDHWGEASERRLFHGTGSTATETIITDQVGFDMRFSDDGLWGRGSYFAEDAAYSHCFAHHANASACGASAAHAWAAKHSSTAHTNVSMGMPCRQIFLAKVAVGRSYNSPPDAGLRRPPPHHHSVTGIGTVRQGQSQTGSDPGAESRVFVLYETTTVAYPEYVITYA